MNRRNFLIYTFYVLNLSYFLPEIIFSKKSYAGVAKVNSKPPFIKETFLKFASPLVNRAETNMIIIHLVVQIVMFRQLKCINGIWTMVGLVLDIIILFEKTEQLSVVVRKIR